MPEANIDDYVIVHAGFTTSKVDESEAKQIFQYLEQMNELELNDLPSEEAQADDS